MRVVVVVMQKCGVVMYRLINVDFTIKIHRCNYVNIVKLAPYVLVPLLLSFSAPAMAGGASGAKGKKEDSR